MGSETRRCRCAEKKEDNGKAVLAKLGFRLRVRSSHEIRLSERRTIRKTIDCVLVSAFCLCLHV